MFPGTLETNPYSIGHTNPLRVMSPAFETTLKEQETKELSQNITRISLFKCHFLGLLTLLPSFGFISFKTRRVLGLAIPCRLLSVHFTTPASLYVY